MTNTKSNAPRNGSTAHGSINGIKLGLNLPNKDKLKQVEDEEKELQRKLAEIQRKKQQLAGSASNNTQQHQRSGGASSYQNSGAAQRSRPPMPAHLQQRAAMQPNAAANNKSIFRSPYNEHYADHPGRRVAAPAHEESYEEDSFVASEEASDVEEDFYEEDWKRALRSVTKYDPSRYYDDGDDRDMEAGFDEIEHEERRSTWLGRKEDAEEERKERERTLRKQGKLPPPKSSFSSGEKRKQVEGGHKNQGPPPKKAKTNNDYAQNQLARAVPGQLVIGSGVKPGAGGNSQPARKPVHKNDDPFF
jgi:hypothetical protein